MAKLNQLKVARNIPDVEAILAEIAALPDGQVISFDTETTGLDVLAPDFKLLSIQFGWKSPDGLIKAGVIPLWHRKNTFFNPDEAWALVAPLLLGSREKVGHNSKYDILAIYWAKGIRVQNVVLDTLLLTHSICSGAQGTYGLKQAVWDYLTESGLGGYEDQLGDLKALKKQLEKAQGEVDVDTLMLDDVFEIPQEVLND